MSAFTGLGVNYAHSGFSWDEPLLTNELTTLKNLGITRIRVNIPDWTVETLNTTLRDKLRNVCSTALSMEFDVVEWGYTNSGLDNLTNTTMTGGYHDALTSCATWAQTLPQAANFVLCLGNEDDERVDGVTVTTAQYQAYVRGTLADDCNAILTSGKTTYSCDPGNYAEWISAGAGSLDKIGLNVYDVQSTFNTNIRLWKVAFPTIGYISEWNSSSAGYNDYNDDMQHAGEIQARRALLMKNNLENYFFGFSFGTTVQQWALKKTDGSYRMAWNVLTNKRLFLVN